MTTYISNVHVC